METRLCVLAALLGLCLTAATSPADEGLPLSKIIQGVEEQGYGPIEVELEDGLWEVEAVKEGTIYELELDPKSGKILSVELEDEDDADDEDEADDQEEAGDEEADPGAEVEPVPDTPLNQLAWLIGQWVDDGEFSNITTKCAWTKNRKFITRSFVVKNDDGATLEGTQVIAWDPIEQQIRSWMFDSEGGFSVGSWAQDGNRWIIKTSHVLATGERASAINVLTPVDDNTLRWKSINREIGGELLPNIPEVTVVRR